MGTCVSHLLGHDSVEIAVDLGAGKVDEAETVFFLQADDVFRADGIALPHRLVKIFAIEASELSRQVVDEIKLLVVENPFELAVMADIAAEVVFAVESVVMRPVQDPHFVALLSEKRYQGRTDSAQPARGKNFHWKTLKAQLLGYKAELCGPVPVPNRRDLGS